MCVIFAKEIARVFLVVLRGSFLLQKAVVSKCEHAGSLLSQPLTVVGNQDLPSRQWLMYCSENNSVLGKPKGFKLLFVVINLKTQVSLKLLIKKKHKRAKDIFPSDCCPYQDPKKWDPVCSEFLSALAEAGEYVIIIRLFWGNSISPAKIPSWTQDKVGQCRLISAKPFGLQQNSIFDKKGFFEKHFLVSGAFALCPNVHGAKCCSSVQTFCVFQRSEKSV